MLALALFIGARLAELPALPPPTDNLPVHRFVADGGLGEHLWFHLPFHEPAPTPSIRLVVSANGRSVEVEGRATGYWNGVLSAGVDRRALGDLATVDGVLAVQGYLQNHAGEWLQTGTAHVRSQAITFEAANRVERMASLRPGTRRARVRGLMGRPDLVNGEYDWYDAHRLVFDARDRFVRWDPLGC